MTQSTTSPAASSEQAPLFADSGLHPLILQAIAETGYVSPTPIQAQAMPVILDGRDVMGAAQTGTGKTAAFTLPILHRLMPLASTSTSPARHPVRALMLTPTRELADQVADNVRLYASRTPLRSAVVFGGVDIAPQKAQLRQGCEVLIATPGRLLDHIEQKTVNLSQVGILVLDEADRMLDMGFLPDLERIIRMLPSTRQTLLFSATFSKDIRKLAHSYLNHPVEIEVAARNAAADTVTQIAYPIGGDAKRAAVVHLVKSKGLKQVIVFSNTKIGTARLARALERDGVRAESIHGDKSQADRIKALDAFKAGELEVLVATDVAARGLDVAGVPCVINYDLPYHAEDYVHRIGRTGRAGASGEAISFFAGDEERQLKDIEKLLGRAVPRGTLDLPSVPRERSPGHRSERGSSSGRGEGRRHDGYRPVQQPVDEFFTKPYEPSEASAAGANAPTNAEGKQRGATGRRPVALLLGGKRA